jgi:glycosyltransferase involved in cell wall biosynthesis
METEPPLISVCMPVYNAERYVAEAVESILAQTYRNFEFLIADDGSTDGSLTILKRYEAQDPRIRLWSRPNAGYVVRLNEMLDEARGDLVARMDADDVALPERFEHQVDFLRDNPDHVLVGSQVLVIDPEGDPLCVWGKEKTHEEIETLQFRGTNGSVISHSAAMYRREPALAVGKYRVEYHPAEDLDLFLRLAERGGRMANLPLVLLKYRMHLSSTCHLQPMKVGEMVGAVLQDARRRRGLPDNTPIVDPSNIRALSPLDHRRKWVWWALKSGYVSTARKHARHCLALAPFSKESWRQLYCSMRGH